MTNLYTCSHDIIWDLFRGLSNRVIRQLVTNLYSHDIIWDLFRGLSNRVIRLFVTDLYSHDITFFILLDYQTVLLE